MQNRIDINCPVSSERVNENTVRVAALLGALVTILGIYFNSYILIGILAIDFELRAFSDGKKSLIKSAAKQLIGLVGVKEKLVDAAPKKFAAGMGLVFTLVIASLQVLHYYPAAAIVGGVLIVCALLEGLFGICLGCIVYSILVKK